MNIIKGTIQQRNVNKICRLCLEEKSELFRLTEAVVISENICEPISEIFKKLTLETIKADDGLPQLMCSECVKVLEASYIFRLRYEETIKIFANYLANVKEESDNDANPVDETSDGDVKTDAACTAGETNECRRRGRKRKCVLSREKIESTLEDLEDGDDEETEDSANQVVLHPCPICPREFSALELRSHARSHKALKKYLTIPSDKKLTVRTKFVAARDIRKMVSIFNKTGDKHTCPYCNESFNIENFRIHVESHRHQDEYKCDDCGRVFRKLNHLNTHRVKHLKEYPYKCEHCGKGFVIQTNYDCHMLTHNSEELPHECRYCLKRFSNPEHLSRHLIIHTENVSYSVKYKVCKCHHCLKTFKDKDELQSHNCIPIEQVSNTRYPCKTCNKIFKHSSGLYNHNRNIHKLKGAKTLCSVCGNHVSNIYNHMMRHSGEKPYQCNQCEKSFFTKTQLRQHLLVHSGLKPYVCSVCAKAFNNLYNLQVHERIHKGDRCHICTICNKGFLEKSYLKKHMHVHVKV